MARARSESLEIRHVESLSNVSSDLSQGVKTVAAAGTPEALVAVSTLVEAVELQAAKAFNTANTGTVFVGFSPTNDANYRRLQAWEVVTIIAPEGKKIDLSQIYVDVVTAGDGVTYLAVN